MATFLRTAAGLMICFAAVHVALGCSIEDITSKLTNCLTISAGDLTNSSAEDILSTFCSNVECNIKCYIDAIGNCYTEDQFFTFNPDNIKVTNRAFCNNQEETLSALTNCQWSDSSCLSTFTTAVQSSLTQYTSGNYAAYRSEYCSALTGVISCVDFTTTATCTAALANTAQAFYEAGFSFTRCGTEEHPLFTTYGGDVTCGGQPLHQNAYVFLVFITVTRFLWI